MMDPRQWDRVHIAAYRRLPKVSGIYACMSGDTVLYGGQARCIRDRWVDGHHRAIDVLLAGATEIAFLPVPIEGLQLAESELLKQEDPPLNQATVNSPENQRQHQARRKQLMLQRQVSLPKATTATTITVDPILWELSQQEGSEGAQ